MTNKDFILKLKEFDACKEAIDYVRDNKYTLKQAWGNCERADWMLWLMCKLEFATQKERIHIICDCAETSLKYVAKEENRPKEAIEAARKYADNPTEENREAAWAAAEAAWAAAEAAVWAARAAARAAWAARAAAEAAWAAARAAWAARAAAEAAWAAAEAAWAAAEAAVWAAEAAGAARAATHKRMCKMIREKIKV